MLGAFEEGVIILSFQGDKLKDIVFEFRVSARVASIRVQRERVQLAAKFSIVFHPWSALVCEQQHSVLVPLIIDESQNASSWL